MGARVAQTGSLRGFLYRTLIAAEQGSKGLVPDPRVSDRAAQTASLRYRRRDDLSLSLRPYPWIQAGPHCATFAVRSVKSNNNFVMSEYNENHRSTIGQRLGE